MVVIVIRAPDDPSPARNKPPSDRSSPNGPSSYDSGVTVDHDFKSCRSFYDRDHFLEAASKDSGYVEYQRVRDLDLLREVHERSMIDQRLDSPASKDSGFSERPRPCKVTRIRYHPGPERAASCTYLSSNSSDRTLTYCPSSSSQADPENALASTKEGKSSTKLFNTWSIRRHSL